MPLLPCIIKMYFISLLRPALNSVYSLRLPSVDRQLPDFDRHVGRYSAGTRRG